MDDSIQETARGPLRADVVVVGAGLTGTVTAHLLADGGADVVVLDAGTAGAPAGTAAAATTTARSTGKLSLLQGTRLAELARLGEDTVHHYVAAGTAGLGWLRRTLAEVGVPVEDRDDLTVATTAEQTAVLDDVLAVGLRHGLPVHWEDEPPYPGANHGAVRLPGQGQVDPLRALAALRARLHARGVAVHDGVRVRQVRRHGTGVALRTTRGTVVADRVVLATGTPPGRVGGLFLRLHAGRSLITTWDVARAEDLPPGFASTMSITAGSPTRSLRTAGNLLMVGGEGFAVGREPDPAARVAALEGWVREHLPVGAARHAWAAQDYTSDTGMPLVGPAVPGDDRVLVATGYAKWGLTTAAAAGLALAGRLLGSPEYWAPALEPWARPARPTRDTVATFAEQSAGWACAATRPSGQRAGSRRVSRVCPHLGGVVRWNDQEQSWDCPVHGSRFAADGAVLDGPATEPLAAR
ncbi:FAD-dependent oxidoreductase [Promicromonospora thailandica]|uniref:Glycine/D-amino acid oxidase (Deaminating) n=1 Tax=Promicromonospora thailandica TaxID=765201 RepID=A0A9X2JWF6_9MICO|nr:FAD-dependent oxidoreductase [Promicromonospora thailandica]MCP2263074.1 Glycine/D-amino acid oxidase (deaminating) [Promicromonospora thailandica]BFF18449.1 FAD-dependent oxidoreductase [Promicromonospora thailandica]